MPGEGLGSVVPSPSDIGRHFSIVNGLSSALLIVLPVGLLAAGAPGSRPSLEVALSAAQDVSLSQLGLLAFVVLVAGTVLHPLQFGLNQFLEGYWGTSASAQRAMIRAVRVQQHRYDALDQLRNEANAEVERIDDELELIGKKVDKWRYRRQHAALEERGRNLIFERAIHSAKSQEADRAMSRLPEFEELMPTRLGNMLRRHESRAGEAFGLDAITVIPYVAQIAADAERDYLDDSRTGLDVAVRMVLVWSLLFAATIPITWRHDVWMIIPLVCLALARVSYLGAVAAADQFGESMTVVIALSRFALYERLGLQRPGSLKAERTQNELYWSTVTGTTQDDIRYAGAAGRK